MTLVIGANTEQVRLLLTDVGKVILSVCIKALARQRNEREITRQFLEAAGVDWRDLECIAVLRIPSSRTSVRVVETIARVASWYEGISAKQVTCSTLDVFDDQELAEAVFSAPALKENLKDAI